MTPTAVEEATVSVAALSELVAAAAAAFPAEGLVSGPADTQGDVGELLPAEDAFVLVVPTSAPGTNLVLVVSPLLLEPMGLSEADGLAAALAPVIAALAGTDEVRADQARLGIGPIGLAGLPAADDATGDVLVAAGLFLGSDHVATIGVAVDGPEPIDHATDAAGVAMDLPEVPAVTRQPAAPPGVEVGGRSLNLLRNVEMNVTAELGRSKMTVADLLSLTMGSVVELDRAAGSPIDLLVNGTLIAKGEVVVIDEEFGVRISEIVDRPEGL